MTPFALARHAFSKLAVALGLSTSLICTSQAAPLQLTDFALRIQDDYSVDLSNFFSESNPVSLFDVLEMGQNSTYEQFLSRLHTRLPQLFENVVLLHNSGSLQLATKESPRAILFGEGLVLSFHEPESVVAGRSVEILAFDPNSENFRFGELNFAANGSPQESNTRSCPVCHSPKLNPIWQPYDFWPQAYGSAISRFKTSEEQQAYESLFARSPQSGVFRYIQMNVNDRGFIQSPETFTQYLSQLNFMRLAAEFRRSEELEPYKYAFFGILGRCSLGPNPEQMTEQLSGFFPEGLWRQFQSRQSFTRIYRSTVSTRNDFKAYLDARYERAFPNGTVIFPVDHDRLSEENIYMSQIRFLFENIGLNLSDYTMSQVQNPYFFSAPSNFAADWLSSLVFYDVEVFRDLSPQPLDVLGFRWFEFDCEALKAKSLASLQGHVQPEPAEVTTTRKSLMGTCISCHSMDRQSQTPYIPFDRTPALREWLRQDNGLQRVEERIMMSGAGVMPPAGDFSETEKRDLIDVFRKLESLP